MVTRTISTKLAIEGEAQYRQAIKNCNAELATMKSALALVESEYRGNANSLEALTAKQGALDNMYAAQRAKVEELRRALEGAQQAQRAYAERVESAKTKIAAAEAEMARLRSSTEDTTEEQAALAGELEKLNSELEEAERYHAAATAGVNNWQKQLNYAQRDLNNLNVEVDKNSKYIAEAKNAADSCATSIDAYGKEVQEAAEDSEEFGDKASSAVDALASVLAAAGINKAVKEIADAFKECLEASVAFEKRMAEVYTLLPGLSDAAYQQMGEDMLQFSSELNVLTKDGVPALYSAISAGVPPENVFAFLTTAQKAAVGGVTDLSVAVDGLTSIVNAYGEANINAQQTADMMFTAVKLGKTTFDELSRTVYNVVPIAASAKIGFENIAAALAVMTAQGVPTAQSTTQLRQMLVELTDSGSDVAKIFESVAGISFKRFIASGGNVQEALAKLEAHADATGIGVNELFSSVEAGSAALSLTGTATKAFVSALTEMENSAGAVDAAYTTMADTTDFAIQRVTVAFDNLKIAIGDILAPSLKELAETGADALEWATDFVEQNPWLIGAISGIATGLGVLTVAITGFTVVTRLAKDMILEFGKALASNPFGLAATAISVLVATLGPLIVQIASAKTETDKFIDSLKESKKAYEELTGSIEDQADGIEDLVKSLSMLNNKENKSEADKKSLLKVIEQLNAAVPGLALAYDEETNSLNLSTAAIEKMVQAQLSQAEYDAYIERRTELLRQQEEVREQLSAKEAEAAAVQGDALVALSAGMDGYSIANERATEAVEQLTEYELELAAELAALDEQYASLADTKEDDIAGNDAQAESILALQDTFINLEIELANLEAAYALVYESALASINSQIGLFDNMSYTVDQTITDLIGNLQSQVDYMATYADNIQKAMEKGVDKGLIEKLSDGSVESAKILAAIVEGGEDEIQALNDTLAEVEKGKEDFATTIAKMGIGFDEAMSDIEERMERAVKELNEAEKAAQSGADTIRGYIRGADSMIRPLEQKFRSLAARANAAFNAELQTRSPSKVFERSGRSSIEGVIVGVEKMQPDLEKTMVESAKIMELAMQGSLSKSMEAPAQQNNTTTTNNNSTTIHVHAAIRQEPDIDTLVRKIGRLVDQRARGKGVLS